MIVYFYEITSNTVHNYSVPSETSAYNPTVFTQNGYFVLRPDIVYRDRNPGVSAVEALVPAVQTVVDMGLVDPDRVGIVGHSWGAYQTTFAVTQTDMFSAAVAGAPLTNLISMYLSIYWNTGGTDARIFEISQGRMEVPFWQDAESYIANSPVFHIENMNTPLLVAFGTEDGAVEFNQGVELYNAARRAGKDMVMLVYEGENHSLAKEAEPARLPPPYHAVVRALPEGRAGAGLDHPGRAAPRAAASAAGDPAGERRGTLVLGIAHARRRLGGARHSSLGQSSDRALRARSCGTRSECLAPPRCPTHGRLVLLLSTVPRRAAIVYLLPIQIQIQIQIQIPTPHARRLN
jgi:dienelactone hydrolase